MKRQETDFSEYCTPIEAAHRLNRSTATVKYYERQGRLSGFRIGKQGVHIYRRADVERLAKELGL